MCKSTKPCHKSNSDLLWGNREQVGETSFSLLVGINSAGYIYPIQSEPSYVEAVEVPFNKKGLPLRNYHKRSHSWMRIINTLHAFVLMMCLLLMFCVVRCIGSTAGKPISGFSWVTRFYKILYIDQDFSFSCNSKEILQSHTSHNLVFVNSSAHYARYWRIF